MQAEPLPIRDSTIGFRRKDGAPKPAPLQQLLCNFHDAVVLFESLDGIGERPMRPYQAGAGANFCPLVFLALYCLTSFKFKRVATTAQ